MYSPKIAEDLIPVLYKIRKQKRVPMTKIVDDILRPVLRTQSESVLPNRGDRDRSP